MTACSAVEPAIDESIGPATRREAEAVGAKEQLEKFVAIKRGKRGKPPAGLVASNFFVPTIGMLDFRDAAMQAMDTAGTPRGFFSIPGLDKWFEDWIMPRPMRGKRRRLLSQANGAVLPAIASAPGDDLSEGQQDLLDALFDLNATSREMRQSIDAAAAKTRVTAASHRQWSLPKLRRLGLIETTVGRGGGCWLTSKGVTAVERTRKL